MPEHDTNLSTINKDESRYLILHTLFLFCEISSFLDGHVWYWSLLPSSTGNVINPPVLLSTCHTVRNPERSLELNCLKKNNFKKVCNSIQK